MKIIKYDSLRNFEFWCGAKDNVEIFTDEQLDYIESQLEELFPDGMEEVDINDMFWFDIDWLKKLVGISDNDDLEEN